MVEGKGEVGAHVAAPPIEAGREYDINAGDIEIKRIGEELDVGRDTVRRNHGQVLRFVDTPVDLD